jgi:hypothetical protein
VSKDEFLRDYGDTRFGRLMLYVLMFDKAAIDWDSNGDRIAFRGGVAILNVYFSEQGLGLNGSRPKAWLLAPRPVDGLYLDASDAKYGLGQSPDVPQVAARYRRVHRWRPRFPCQGYSLNFAFQVHGIGVQGAGFGLTNTPIPASLPLFGSTLVVAIAVLRRRRR